jgi:hypothetical protein
MVEKCDFSSHLTHLRGMNISLKISKTSSFRVGTTISRCQGIEETGKDKDSILHVIVTLQSLRQTQLKTPYSNCRQPLRRSRGRWLHYVKKGMRRRIMLEFGSETYWFYAEIIAFCKPPIKG